jgi:serine/threonine protein kinase
MENGMSHSLIGKTIGKYQIVEHLGRGGMAEVYKAYQPALDRFVAIKLMHSFLADDKDFLGRFQREAKAIGRLRHPNIVQVHDFDVEEGMYYMVMEFIDGYTLKKQLVDLAAENQMLSVGEALRVTRDVAAALAYAHKRDMVHRDVKPANVMINKENQVILTDFGIAKILSGPQFTASGAMIGTPAYMSPEQGLGEPGDARSDIYSLGIMLFQMITGQLPYDADTPLAVVLKHVNDPLPIPSQINPSMPPDVERIIFKSLAKDPDHRYQTADEFIKHLDRVAAGLSIPESDLVIGAGAPQATGQSATVLASPTRSAPTYARTPTAQAVAAPPARARRPAWLWPVIGIVAILLAAVAVVAAFGLPGSSESQTPIAVKTTDELTKDVTSEGDPSNTPEPVATHIDPVAAAQTALAQQNATLTAQVPTSTPTLTPSLTPQPTPTSLLTFTPSPTPTLACEYSYELATYYTFNNPNNYNQRHDQTSAPVDSGFPITVRLLNQSTCPLPSSSNLILLEGEALGAEETIALTDAVEVDATATFTTRMTSDDETGVKTSTWELQLPDGTPIGNPFELNVYIYSPATPTPVPPTVPAATATPEEGLGAIDFNYFVSGCEYAGDQWRCWLNLTPYGGVGQPYTFLVFDAAQPVRYYGGNADHLISSRRCSSWIHEIKLQDDGGNAITKNVYIDPNSYFAGGCQLP